MQYVLERRQESDCEQDRDMILPRDDAEGACVDLHTETEKWCEARLLHVKYTLLHEVPPVCHTKSRPFLLS